MQLGVTTKSIVLAMIIAGFIAGICSAEVTANKNPGSTAKNGKDGVDVKALRDKAEKGDADAQLLLGTMYCDGKGVGKNRPEALKWYTKAAQQGSADGQFLLGEAYYDGKGVTKDRAEAARWYTKAAEQGDALAQYELGSMYWKGEGVTADQVEAYKWIILAAAQGNKASIKLRADMEGRLAASQIAEAQKLAREFKLVVTGAAKGSGTGFFITADGVAVTAWHVVKDASAIKVMTAKGTKAAKVLKVDEANDIALLKVEGDGYRALAVAPSRGVKASDEVSILAYSTGLQGFEWKWKYTKGNISSLSGEQNDLRYFQISTLVLPVFSGGPLLDASGNVVGIVVAKSSEETGAVPQNVNYAAKSSLLLNLVEAVPGLVERMPEAKPAKGNADEIVEDAKQGVVLVVCY